MELIVKVTSPGLRAPLADLLRLPLGLDVWEVKPDHLILRAAEPQIDRLARMGFGVEQLQDVETHLRAFATAEAVSGYHSAASLEQELRQLADARPDICERREIGRSVEGRVIHALRIGERHGGQTPKILFMGCHHAREWIAVEVPFLLAKELVERADDPEVAGWLSRAEIWVAPMVNPDGHEHSRVEQRLWRKNRRPNRDGSIGVDPNRNYGYMWGTLNVPTSSHVPPRTRKTSRTSRPSCTTSLASSAPAMSTCCSSDMTCVLGPLQGRVAESHRPHLPGWSLVFDGVCGSGPS